QKLGKNEQTEEPGHPVAEGEVEQGKSEQPAQRPGQGRGAKLHDTLLRKVELTQGWSRRATHQGVGGAPHLRARGRARRAAGRLDLPGRRVECPDGRWNYRAEDWTARRELVAGRDMHGHDAGSDPSLDRV